MSVRIKNPEKKRSYLYRKRKWLQQIRIFGRFMSGTTITCATINHRKKCKTRGVHSRIKKTGRSLKASEFCARIYIYVCVLMYSYIYHICMDRGIKAVENGDFFREDEFWHYSLGLSFVSSVGIFL